MAATKSNGSTHGYVNILANWYTAAPEITRRNVAAFSAAGKLYAELAQSMAKHQQELTQHTLSQTSAALRDIMSTGNPAQRMSKQLDLGKKTLQSYVARSEEVADLVARSHREAAEIFTRRTAELIDETKTQIEKAQVA
jgi:phasin family protein